LAKQILGIVNSQIETKRIFSLSGIHTNLRRSHWQLENLENIILVKKNWPNDVRVGCKVPFSLVKLIDFEIDTEEDLDEFEFI
jgi:hypothetical protein